MEEIIKLRVNKKFAHLLFNTDEEGIELGASVFNISISKNDPRIHQIPVIVDKLKLKYNEKFFFGWEIIRKYTSKEFEAAKLFNLKLTKTFEPAGEDCGTVYDEISACKICGVNRRKIGPLILKRGSIPKKDISRTIAGELVVSQKFVSLYTEYGLSGLSFEPIVFENGINSDFFHPVFLNYLDLSTNRIISGINPFDLSVFSQGEVYKCPEGHTLGLNLISEAFVKKNSLIGKLDFFKSKQKFGVKRGVLRPNSIYFTSPQFRNIVKKEKLSGFDFEITHII